jgi:large subunit ribosomal protein L17
MRHRVGQRKLGRVTEHRLSMLRNQATALLQHGHIETTLPKAKELRPFVERLITIARRGVAAGAENGQALHARRMVLEDLQDRAVVKTLFDEIAPRFAARPGGYVRILKAGVRRGDAAPVALVELIGSEFDPKKAAADKEQKAAKKEGSVSGLGSKLKAAADRVRGRKKADDGESEPAAHPNSKASRQSATKARHAGRSGKGS